MTGSEGARCGSIMDIRNLNAASISESESEPKLHAIDTARRQEAEGELLRRRTGLAGVVIPTVHRDSSFEWFSCSAL